METKLWPGDNAAADTLLARFLDRAAPGWSIRRLEGVRGSMAQEVLWPWGQRFKGHAAEPGTPMGEIAVDRALELYATGAPFPWETLGREGEKTLMARVMIALTGASYAALDGDETVLRLPPGLNARDRARAIELRLLYQAPLSIEGM